MKTCKKCSIEKELNEFYKEKKNLDGVAGTCKKCFNLRNKEWVEQNRDNRKQIYTKYQKENKEKCHNASNRWRDKHRNSVNAQARKRRKEAPGLYKATKARRRAAEIQAIPKWMTDEEWKLIIEFYKNCPEGYEVDHIIPLQGKTVRGFHCLSNLQYLTKSENRKKGAKVIPRLSFDPV